MADPDMPEAANSTRNDELYPHPGTKLKSDVWKYFGFQKKDKGEPPYKNNLDMSKAFCKLCRKSYTNTGNTTNFRVHIESEHKLAGQPETKTIKPPAHQTKLNFDRNTMGIHSIQGPLSKDRAEKIDVALQKLIVGKVLPISLVENEFLRSFVKELDPRYKLPTRQKLLSSLLGKREEISHKITADLRNVDGVGITHDGWTSNNTESYNTTTVHYITQDWEMKTATLETKKMEGSHTSEALAESIMETKVKWNLPEVIATSDNAANEVKAFKLLSMTRFGCYGHRINLVVKKSMEEKEIHRFLAKGRRLVTLFHASSSLNDYLHEKQRLLLPYTNGHKLINDVVTRWNSSLAMISRLNEQAPTIMAVLADPRPNKKSKDTMKASIFSFEERSVIEKVIDVLQPFKDATDIMCSEKIPTISKVLPTVVKLKRSVQPSANDPPAVRAIKAKMCEELEQRTEAEDIALLGTILNPFTKGFEFLPEKKFEAETILRRLASGIKVVVKQEKTTDEPAPLPDLPTLPDFPTLPDNPVESVNSLQSESDNQTQQNMDAETTTSNSEHEMEDIDASHATTPNKKQKVEILKSVDMEDWFSGILFTGVSQMEAEDAIQAEITRYLSAVMQKKDTKLTLLEWWKTNSVFYPRLSVMARKFLCVQASSVSSERVFSLAGELVSKKRSRLSPSNVDLFIFLNKNMKNFW